MIKRYLQNTKGIDYWSLSKCFLCKKDLIIGEVSDFSCNHYVCNDCYQGNTQCKICGNKEKLLFKRQISVEILKFVQVNCTIHSNRTALKGDPKNFQTFCDLCPTTALSLHEFDFYKLLNTYFDEVYKNWRKKICPERRKTLISLKNANTQGLLEACRWLFQLNSEVNCCVTQTLPGKFIDLNTFQCYSEKPHEAALELSKSTIVFALREHLKSAKPEVLNKFLLKIGQYSENFPLPLLILEGKDLLSGFHSSSHLRCCYCHETLSLGNKTPIKLSCGHVICFKCHMADYVSGCPIDQIPINSPTNYYGNSSPILPNCHNFHSLVNYAKNVYKLPCFHYSCEDCIMVDACKTCGDLFGLVNAKLDKKVMNVLEFCRIYCEVHNQPATFFNTFNLQCYCERCENVTGLPISLFPNINYLLDQITPTFLIQLQSLKNLPDTLQPNDLKQCIYYNIIDYQARYLLTKVLKNIVDLGTKPQNSPKFHKRFPVIFPSCTNSSKAWRINPNEISKILITSKKRVILTGIIFGGQVHRETHDNEVKAKAFAMKSIRLLCKDKIILDLTAFPMCMKIENLIPFAKGVILDPNGEYSLEIEAPEGNYFHGSPFFREELGDFKLSWQSPGKNHAIGGPLLGLLTSPLGV